ncbi:MAG: hydrogenase formation protein HypD, partial [Anaerolineaceae bacterium]|nr:hydrogenase formation protein HypD [Anaerolineaceae bacterium]
LVQGILMTVQQLEAGTHQVTNAYPRVVTRDGNPAAQAIIHRVYEACDRKWRGIGLIPMSGWRLREEYGSFDAERRFSVAHIQPHEAAGCIAGQVLQGLKKPPECSSFGKQCTPENPLGATMVSSEGACSAYYRSAKHGLVMN